METGYFKIIVDGKLKTYSRFSDIPMIIDNVISFRPDMPEPPHGDQQHESMGIWNLKLQELMDRQQ